MATQQVRKLTDRDADGNPTGEETYGYMPRSFLVAGRLNEFVTEHGVNEDRHRSFELFRRNTSSPEIITFDERPNARDSSSSSTRRRRRRERSIAASAPWTLPLWLNTAEPSCNGVQCATASLAFTATVALWNL